VHLRRALLLFAIVLGIAALVGAIAAPPDEDAPNAPDTVAEAPPPTAAERTTPRASAREVPGQPTLRFAAGGRPERRELGRDRSATVTVRVPAAGLVELAGLEATEPAQPETPARFELLGERPGRYPVLFTPAGEETFERVGTLVVTSGR
jgi:hypothetical protein